MNILLCLSHSIEESDQLRLFHDLGYGVASIGGYIDPGHPHDPKRPPLPDIPLVPEIKDAVDALGTTDNLGAAQSFIPWAALDWLGDDGVIIFHHYLERLYGQWDHIRDWMNGSSRRRVIWRSVGQSVEHNERLAVPYRKDGLERVAYSPNEANIPGYSGHDALIRFYKDPDEWDGWVGDVPKVINITQHLYQRHPYTNAEFWDQSTKGLDRVALGPGSEQFGGGGEITYDVMKWWLQHAGAYLYTGTQPASYTLGLIEAGMTGIPLVSIGPKHMTIFPYGHELFEAAAFDDDWPSDGMPSTIVPADQVYNDPARAHAVVNEFLTNRDKAATVSAGQRRRFIDLFGREKIGGEWARFLG